MTTPETPSPWFPTISPADERLYAAAGFGRSAGLGDNIAILVIDVQYRTVGHTREPIADAMREYPTACGDRGWGAVDNIALLLTAARAQGVPVLFPHVAPKTATTPGGFRAKSPSLASPDAAAYEFVAEAAPLPGEQLIPKDHPSAFFGTGLVSALIQMGIDTVLLTGCTTSGCVRASAVDAFSFGFTVGVVTDAVYDRTDTVHAASLFDLSSKYADLISTAGAVHLITAGDTA
ncbi:nicotinamidase-related amidase [Glaciihabitans tibetensis]|uniref:Nicotinamidase-related amidase n=1 Tax=Glaciihabitans tibetensis TaxID=1266600 RepID=A0A2T0VJV8_9MICO|nr:isochorismatase family protein [Glaciihabitans tibetensis]PRY70516.1 nicotinamidase-related amidase [Glaciihabitans tibetensis]